MKTIITLIIFTTCIVTNVFSQTKTPYEKKVDQIMAEMCQAIGVESSLIQMALKLNDWDIVKSSQDFAFKSRMMDRNELLVIVLASEQKLKDAAKLKNNIDLQRESDKKKQEEEKKQLAEEKKLKTKIEKQQKLAEIELKERLKNSDYVKIIDEVSESFNKWLEKGEFEKTVDYEKRIEDYKKGFLNISNKIVLKQTKERDDFSDGHSYFNFHDYFENNVQLLDYNPDKEFFIFKINFKYLEFIDTLPILLKDAERFKNYFSYHYISLPNDNVNYCIFENYIYPTKILITGFREIPDIEIVLKFPSKHSEISFSTNDLKLVNFKKENLKYNFSDFGRIQIENKLITARRNMTEGNLDSALNNYKDILILDESSEEAKSKIEQISLKVSENKRENLISDAIDKLNIGLLEESKKLFLEVNKIRISDDISEKIKQIDFELNLKKERLSELKNGISIAKNNHEINLKQQYRLLFNLEQVDYGYRKTYSTCVDTINKQLNSSWVELESDFKLFYSDSSNDERWLPSHQALLEKVIVFNSQFMVFKTFETNISNALNNKDKKYLKVLKNKDINIIINEVISENN